MPIHAYVRLASSNTWTDWTPQSTQICWSATQNTCAGGSDGSITVNNVPADAEVWVTAHLDFRCKGESYTCATSVGTDPLKKPVTYSFNSKATVKVAGVPVNESYTSATLIGRGKKVTMTYGALTNKTTGSPLANVWVRVSKGISTRRSSPERDGFYVLYDGQACNAGDGIAGGCKNGTTTLSTWDFANGSNVATTIRILGTEATPLTPTAPVAGAAAANPGGHGLR